MDRYRNNYKNSSKDEYSGGTWVYINGELYHAGIKGMHWYQHLPGTDWWKTFKNYRDMDTHYQNMTGNKSSKLKSTVTAIRSTARDMKNTYGNYLKGEASYYGEKMKKGARNAYNTVSTGVRNAAKSVKSGTSKFWNDAKGFTSEQIAKLSELAKNAYASVRGSVTNFLEKGKGLDDYIKQKISGSGVNAWFENAKQGILKGVNSFLDKIGMRKETDSFITKVSNKKISDFKFDGKTPDWAKAELEHKPLNVDLNSPENKRIRKTTIFR